MKQSKPVRVCSVSLFSDKPLWFVRNFIVYAGQNIGNSEKNYQKNA